MNGINLKMIIRKSPPITSLALITILFIAWIPLSHQTTLLLPIPSTLMSSLVQSIDILQSCLLTMGTALQNKRIIQSRVNTTRNLLLQVNKILSQFDGYVSGVDNLVAGKKNIVFGNNNRIKGNNNWVFVSNYSGRNIYGDLIVNDFRVEMDKISLILVNPNLAISYINQDKNKELKNKYFKKQIQLTRQVNIGNGQLSMPLKPKFVWRMPSKIFN